VHMLSSEHQVHVARDLIPVLPPVLWLGHSLLVTGTGAWQPMKMKEQAL
jgi:hypothetical protein